MNLYIETDALQGDSDRMLRRGALYGMKRLREAGHRLLFKPEELTPSQQALLENEGIDAETEADRAELRVTAGSEGLELQKTDGVVSRADDWIELSRGILFPARRAEISRRTSETEIQLRINLDGKGEADIHTGIGFLDHMLEQIARHGLVDLRLRCEGDLSVDEHHTIEDTAIALGEAIGKALGDKTGVQRYAFVLPMDESRSTVALDLSGRPYLRFEGNFSREKVGEFPTEMTEHFFYSLAINLKATLHIAVQGENDHHKIESAFKGFARCLRSAVSRSERSLNVLPSTKDLL